MSEERKHGWDARYGDPNFGGIDDGHDYTEDAYTFVKNRALDLTDDRLRDLYDEIAFEMRRRDETGKWRKADER